MSRSRSRAAKMRTSIPWGRAAVATATVAVVAGPLAALITAPRVAEAFVTPDMFFGASSSFSSATATAAAKPHRGWSSATGPAVMFTGRRARGGGGRRFVWTHYAAPAATAAEGGVYLGVGDNPNEGQLSSAIGNTASFMGGWGAGMKFGAGAGRRRGPEPLRSSVSGGGEDDMLPESMKLPAGGVDGSARAEDGEKGEEEEDDGSWSDAEVERRVAERRVSTHDPYAVDDEEEEEDLDAEVYEEIVANMTKPLGITIEASTDQAELIYITSVGQQAEDAGLAVGDLLTGVSAVFGNDVWSVKGKNIEKVRSLVRCRTEPFILVRVERGHISLEERCSEGFGIVEDADCWRLTEDGECEVEYTNLWSKVYKEEREVLTGEEGAAGAGAGGGQKKKKTNEPPPPRDTPGLGSSFSGDQWGGSDY